MQEIIFWRKNIHLYSSHTIHYYTLIVVKRKTLSFPLFFGVLYFLRSMESARNTKKKIRQKTAKQKLLREKMFNEVQNFCFTATLIHTF